MRVSQNELRHRTSAGAATSGFKKRRWSIRPVPSDFATTTKMIPEERGGNAAKCRIACWSTETRGLCGSARLEGTGNGTGRLRRLQTRPRVLPRKSRTTPNRTNGHPLQRGEDDGPERQEGQQAAALQSAGLPAGLPHADGSTRGIEGEPAEYGHGSATHQKGRRNCLSPGRRYASAALRHTHEEDKTS